MKNKVITILTTACLAVTFIASESTYASSVTETHESTEQSQELILGTENIISDIDSITLDWNNSGDYYKLYNENELIYEGEVSQFTHNNLTPKHVYKYVLESYSKDSKLIDSMHIKTSTLSNPPTIQKARAQTETEILADKMSNLQTETIIKKDKIVFDWDDIEGVNEYIVKKNDVTIGSISQSYFVDTNINVNEKYKYTFVGKRKLSEEVIQNQIVQMGESYEQLSDSEKERLEYQTFEVSKTIDSVNESLNVSARAAASGDIWVLRYNTFIADAFVKPPVQNPSGWVDPVWFNGNNRSWDFNATDNSKTSSDSIISFVNATPSTLLFKKVGPTLIYTKKDNGNYVYQDRDQASDTGIKMTNISISPGYVGFKLIHDVSIAYKYAWLFSAPSINVDISGDFYRDGSWKIAGYHDSAPNHEVYLQKNYGTVETIHRDTITSFWALAPPTTDVFFSAEN
ncbi:DUF3238 domain-containing protein [Paenibacillus glycanilyticus]|uniref:DUF3238 domain-containing protein n=1 Tax=Paenibacillus glycanilyticus TaxID=126569 RepID=UPI000FDA2D8A|nr:DUF3238 domain-containing protein [Paenibacillus glycanilyticus]